MILYAPGYETSYRAPLTEEWRRDARILREWGCEHEARMLETAADQLESHNAGLLEQRLTLEQASELSGYSCGHLARLITSGTIPNAGRTGAPRIRRGDLPRKPVGKSPSQPHVDPTQIVQSIINGGN